MLIGELAKKTGLQSHTIRYYEKEGLIAKRYIQRGANRYRHYADEVVERIGVIQSLQAAGFTLSEIKDLLERWDAGMLAPPKGELYLRRKLGEVVKRIDEKIAELEQTKAAMSKLAVHISADSHSSKKG